MTKSVFCNVAAIGIIALTLSFARADHIDSPNYVAIPARSGRVQIHNNIVGETLRNSARLSYRLLNETLVLVTVYNLAGNVVRRLLNATQPSGNYSIVWDGTNDNGERAALGLYFIRIIAGDIDEYNKILLVR